MKKLMLVLGMLFFTFQLSFAQTELKKDSKQQLKKEQFIEKLDLTKDQSAKFKSLQEATSRKKQAIMQSDLNREEKKEKIKAIQQNKDQDLKSILDENQFSKYQEMKKMKRGKMKKRSIESKKAIKK